MDSYIKMWKNYFNFQDRTTRKDYWMSVLINFLISLVLGFFSGLFTNFPIIGKLNIMDLISYIYFILILIPGLAQSVRRMHDVNKSGWYLLMSLIPIIGWIIVLVQECSPSVDVNNNYGTKL